MLFRTASCVACEFFLPVIFLSCRHRHYVTFHIILGDLKHCALLILGGGKLGWREPRVHRDVTPGNSAPHSCLILSYECGPQMSLWNAT